MAAALASTFTGGAGSPVQRRSSPNHRHHHHHGHDQNNHRYGCNHHHQHQCPCCGEQSPADRREAAMIAQAVADSSSPSQVVVLQHRRSRSFPRRTHVSSHPPPHGGSITPIYQTREGKAGGGHDDGDDDEDDSGGGNGIGSGDVEGPDHQGWCLNVNVFFYRKGLLRVGGIFDSKDPFANKDVLPAQKACKALEAHVLPELKQLPENLRRFYAAKMCAILLGGTGANIH
eukprot:GHVU01122766.1.p1 GENE.GHVU01122766.1~~GHVU01122766.1.p1  ORF type:complete len:262 (+),score=46.47 GHVU01122766.1:99-788(+)